MKTEIKRQEQKIGFFGGTFDPIHFGHLNLAIEVFEKMGLDQILFCPAYIAPHKISTPPVASAKDRYEMVKIAIEDIKNFSIIDEEIVRKGVSYTIDTLQALKEKYPNAKFYLILAQDSMIDFLKWKDYKKILHETTLIIGYRPNSSEIPQELLDIYNKNLIMTKQFEISSTNIRDRLKRKLYCGHLIPSKVLDYIYKKGLY